MKPPDAPTEGWPAGSGAEAGSQTRSGGQWRDESETSEPQVGFNVRDNARDHRLHPDRARGGGRKPLIVQELEAFQVRGRTTCKQGDRGRELEFHFLRGEGSACAIALHVPISHLRRIREFQVCGRRQVLLAPNIGLSRYRDVLENKTNTMLRKHDSPSRWWLVVNVQ
jgi:hypothetical protein